MRIVLVVISVVIGIIGITRLPSRSTNSNEIVIGVALSLTGDSANWGEIEKNAIELALKDLGQKTGDRVRVVYEDTGSTAKGSITAVKKLVSVDNVSAIIGPTWLDTFAGAQSVVEGTNIPLIAPSASITAIQGNNPLVNVFSTYNRTDTAMKTIVSDMKSRRITELVLFTQNDPYYTEYSTFLIAEAQQSGIRVSIEKFNPQDDVKSVVAKYSTSQAVFFAAYDESLVVSLLKNVKLLIPDTALYTDHNGRDMLANPAYATYLRAMSFVETVPADKDFIAAYTNAYGTNPTLSASNTYDAVMIVVEALRHADPISYISKNSFTTTSFGRITFDTIGGVVPEKDSYHMVHVVNGVIE